MKTIANFIRVFSIKCHDYLAAFSVLCLGMFLFTIPTLREKNKESEAAIKYIDLLQQCIDEDMMDDVISETDEYSNFYHYAYRMNRKSVDKMMWR